MKFLLLALVCAVAVSAAPDELIKLDQLSSTIKEAVTTEEAVAPASPPISTASQGTVADRTRLVETLFKDYNKKVNPDDVKLKFGVTLLSFRPCTVRSVLDSYVWLKYDWEDKRLAWDPQEYGGATVLRIDADDVWKPDVTLYNSADMVNMVNCWHSNVLIFSSGKLLWVPPCKMTSHCVFNPKTPYGEQTCTLKFGSWTFDGNVVDIQFYNGTSTIDTSEMFDTSDYEVVSTSGERHEKYYSCCVEPYPDLTYNVTIKRRPGEELLSRHH